MLVVIGFEGWAMGTGNAGPGTPRIGFDVEAGADALVAALGGPLGFAVAAPIAAAALALPAGVTVGAALVDVVVSTGLAVSAALAAAGS